MVRLARLMTHRTVAWATVLFVLLIAGGSTWLAMHVEQDDDLLAFLPADDPDVRHFHELASRFGGLDVALVGVDAGVGKSVFTTDFLARLKRTTEDLADTRGLDGVVSLHNVTDFIADKEKGGIITGPLVGKVPSTAAGLATLRKKVLSRDHVLGTFVSRDGRATLIYAFLAHGSNPRRVATSIKQVVDKHFPKHARYWGGNPFISAYIFDTTQQDMRRLTPWAVLAMVIVMMIAFRDFLGTCLALLSTSFGIVIAIGLMRLFGEPINLVLSSMPVILFAVGSAYGIHILAHYYVWVRRREEALPAEDEGERRAAAIIATLRATGPTVLAAGLTTVVSLLSFLAMDLRPMRVFGLFTGIGVLVTLILSLTFIPAVARLVKLRGRVEGGAGAAVERLLIPLVDAAQRWRVGATVLLIVVALGAGVAVLRVENRIDATNLFSEGSPPARADRFMAKYFGGSQFLQVHIKADLDDPLVLRELTYLGDQLRFFPHVSSVMGIGEVISRANEAMEGQRRIPDSRAKIRMLQAFVSGEVAVKQLVADKHRQALLQIKLGTSDSAKLEELLERIEKWIGNGKLRRYQRVSVHGKKSQGALERQRAMVAARIRAALVAEGLRLSVAQQGALETQLARPATAADSRPIVARLVRFMRSQECAAALPKTLADGSDPAPKLAAALIALGRPPRLVASKKPKKGGDPDALSPWEKKLQAVIAQTLALPATAELVDDVLLSIKTPLTEITFDESARQQARLLLARAGVTLPGGALGERVQALTAAALLDLRAPQILMPVTGPEAPAERGDAQALAAATLLPRVNGLPTIHRALSRSALHNQLLSLATALIPVIVIMVVLFRSLTAGLLVATPTLLTLLLIYGGMGLLGVRLDIGTAMLACIILGAGVDYGVHLVACWRDAGGDRRAAARTAVRATGTAIWTNALTVAIGFFVLTRGDARPLQNVGGLTAMAMLVAALATFWAVPVLARRANYGRAVKISDELLVPSEKDALPRPTSASGSD